MSSVPCNSVHAINRLRSGNKPPTVLGTFRTGDVEFGSLTKLNLFLGCTCRTIMIYTRSSRKSVSQSMYFLCCTQMVQAIMKRHQPDFIQTEQKQSCEKMR